MIEINGLTKTFGPKVASDNLTLNIGSGISGLVGENGAGKSTLFRLIANVYTQDSGTITIDGVNIKELDKESIRGNITIVSQNPYIFNMSIKDNLKIVKNQCQ